MNLEGINNVTGLGYQCGCNAGYQLAPNNHDCNGMYVYKSIYILHMYKCDDHHLDIYNCLINDHNCSQICVEVEGSFNCSCYSGYELQEDRATCAGN